MKLKKVKSLFVKKLPQIYFPVSLVLLRVPVPMALEPDHHQLRCFLLEGQKISQSKIEIEANQS